MNDNKFLRTIKWKKLRSYVLNISGKYADKLLNLGNYLSNSNLLTYCLSLALLFLKHS